MRIAECPRCKREHMYEPEYRSKATPNCGHGTIVDPAKRISNEIQCTCGTYITFQSTRSVKDMFMKSGVFTALILALFCLTGHAQTNPKFAPYGVALFDTQTNSNSTVYQIKNPDVDFGVGVESNTKHFFLDTNASYSTANNKLANGGYGYQLQGTIAYKLNSVFSLGGGAFWQVAKFNSFKALESTITDWQSAHPFVSFGISAGPYMNTLSYALPGGINGFTNERIFTNYTERQLGVHYRLDAILAFNNNNSATTVAGTKGTSTLTEIGTGVKFIW